MSKPFRTELYPAEVDAAEGAVRYERRRVPSGGYTRPIPKLSRNIRCPCGSGRKLKHCHQGNLDDHLSRAIGEHEVERFMRRGG